MSSNSLPTFLPFDCRADSKAVRWSKWNKRLETLFVAYEVTDAKRKQALLLSYGGEDLHDIWDTFTAAQLTPAQDTEETVYSKTVDAFTAHFNPSSNTEYQKYLFRHTVQETDKIDDYYTILRHLAPTCQFTDSDAEIKSQIISGCTSDKVRKKGLSDPKITLDALLAFARLLELTDAQAQQIQKKVNFVSDRRPHNNNSSNNSSNNFKKWTKKKPQGETAPVSSPKASNKSAKKCRNCGYDWPHKGGQFKCPARNKKCSKCEKMGHLSSLCMSSQQVRTINSDDSLLTNNPADDDDCDYLFAIGKSNMPTFTVCIENHPVLMLADSGASVNILSASEYNAMPLKPPLQTHKRQVRAYGASTPLCIIGKFVAHLKHGKNSCTAPILVVEGDSGCLLSWNTSQELNLLAIAHSIPDNSVSHNWIDEYPDLFIGLGKLKDFQVRLHIDNAIQPVAQKYRRVPFHIRGDIEEQLASDEALGVIEKPTGPTPWVSPVVCVPKPKTGKTRLCVDMRAPNTAIRREHHSTPTVSEMISDLAGSKMFSKLDLNQGYNQLELHPESRYITTFATHVGLRQYTRLSFGINSAAEVFQEAIRQALTDLKGVMNISDDILVYGSSKENHDENLRATLQRLREKGLTLKREKCEFNKTSVEFFGHIFSDKGVSPSPDKISAILKLPSPTNQSELRSLLGMTNYCGSRFVPDYSTLTHELRLLTQKDMKWSWEKKHEDALRILKNALSKCYTLNYFSAEKETELYVDASPIGLCGILMQKDKDSKDRSVIQFASRALTPTESRYSQTEREALAVTWACEHYHLYIYGAPFRIITDHKPLVSMFGNPRAQLPARIERWAMRLQPYAMKVEYQMGKLNPADYLSRHPVHSQTSHREMKVAEEYINYLAESSTPKTMSLDEIGSATLKDPTLKAVISALESGRWHTYRESANVHSKTYDILHKVRSELSLAKDHSILLKGSRIVMPSELQQRTVQLAHCGHQGIVKTIALLREKVWFCGIHKAVEAAVKDCFLCQVATPTPSREPLRMSPLPSAPWEELSADFCQIPNGTYLLVVQDEYSRYVVVDNLTSLTAGSVIPRFDKIFSEFGIPSQLKTDNGPPFNSYAFADYLEHMGIKHRKITPLWPRANAETERFMRTIKKTVKGASALGNWKQELYKLLLAYRATPHSSTGKAPASVLFGRDIKTRLPSLVVRSEDDELRAKDTQSKTKMKDYADRKNFVKYSDLTIGDPVIVKNHPHHTGQVIDS